MPEVVGGVVDGINQQGNGRDLILCLSVSIAQKERVDIGEQRR